MYKKKRVSYLLTSNQASRMTQEQMLAGVKKDVRSLLMSSKLGLLPEQLKKDYASLVGNPLPLKQLGFRNVMDMISEMPDVASVSYLNNGNLVLKAVGDESTRGIQELILKQRVSKSNIKLTSKKVGVGYFSPRHSQQRVRPSSVALPRRGSVPPAVAAKLRVQLRQLLSQGPILLSELESSFARCFGHPLRVTNYGFYSIAEVLAAASDFITVKPGHLGSVLTLNGPPTAMPLGIPRPLKIGHIKSVPSPAPKSSKVKPVAKGTGPADPSPPSPSSIQKCLTPLQGPAVISKGSEMEQESQQIEKNEQDVVHFHNLISKLEAELQQRILENGDAGVLSPELKAKLQQVIAQRENGLSVHDLPAEYMRLFGEEFPLAQSGFLSVTEMVGALTDIFHLRPVGDEGHDWIVTDIVNTSNTSSGGCQSDGECGSKEVNLSDPSYYFSCGDSPWDTHGEEENTSLDIEDEISTDNTEQQIPEICKVKVQDNSAVPPDAMCSQRLKPPTLHAPRKVLPIVVEHVVSPNQFYIRFMMCKEAYLMEDMMIDMRTCYSCPEVSDRYCLPEHYVQPGQVCCVAPDHMWFYRVIIHRVVSSDQVQVYFVDFGDLTVVQRTDLKFLKSCYSELPAQAVPSSLAGITPMKGSWTAEAKGAFLNLCQGYTLVAALHSYQGDVLHLFLCDTSTEEDVYIHSVLQKENHGLACASDACTALFDLNPVSQYMGEEVLDKDMEVEEEVEPSANTPLIAEHSQQPCTLNITPSVKEEETVPEVPGLEYIEDLKCTLQNKQANPFQALLEEDPSLVCRDGDQDWTPEPSTSPVQEEQAMRQLHQYEHQRQHPDEARPAANLAWLQGDCSNLPPAGTENPESWPDADTRLLVWSAHVSCAPPHDVCTNTGHVSHEPPLPPSSIFTPGLWPAHPGNPAVQPEPIYKHTYTQQHPLLC